MVLVTAKLQSKPVCLVARMVHVRLSIILARPSCNFPSLFGSASQVRRERKNTGKTNHGTMKELITGNQCCSALHQHAAPVRCCITQLPKFMFSRMRSKGSRFTLGVWGLRVCVRSTLRLRPQLPATVRNRPREVAVAVPMASFATVVTLGGFRRRVASCCVADVAFCDIPTCFMTCQKSFCVAGAILLHRFQKMSCSSPARRSTLRHFAWQAHHFGRVASHVFYESR